MKAGSASMRVVVPLLLTALLALAAPVTLGGEGAARAMAAAARGVAKAEHTAARGITYACGALNLDGVWFRDSAGLPVATRDAVRCLAGYGTTTGYTDRTYRGGLTVPRYQMALFLRRVVDYAVAHGGVELPPDVPDPGFTDTGTLSAEARDAIALLAELGVTTGTSPTRFSPFAQVSRRDMASFIVRLQDVIEEGSYDTDEQDLFPDVPGTLPRADDINALAAQGIAGGYADGTFRPFDAVTRAHMALFLMRHTDENVASDRLPALADVPRPPRTRAVWVHAFDESLKTRAGIARLVEELEAADADAVLAQVVRRHDAYYDSDVLPATPDPALEPGLDVLDELTSVAHAAGLEVHAWVSVAPTWHEAYAGLEAPEGWVYTEHGPAAPEGQRWVTRTVDGQWSTYLDPALPEVRAHVAAIVAELAGRYPVDGVHLDYVRYESARHGYHPDALERYAAESGNADVPAPGDAAWSAWRRAQTRAVVEEARAALGAVDSEAALSAAVITWGPGPEGTDGGRFEDTLAYTRALQDWPAWAHAGLVEAVMPMNYFRDHVEEQAIWFGQWMRFQGALAHGTDTRVVPGVAGYLNAPTGARAQIFAAMQATAGAVVYSYQQPTVDGSRDIWQQLADTWWGEVTPRD